MEDMLERLHNHIYLRLPEIMVDEAESRLAQMCLETVIDNILIYCNLTEIPTELKRRTADWAFGEYLKSKFNSGELSESSISSAVQSISAGDVSVNYGGTSAGDRINAITSMLEIPSADLNRFRKLRW